VYQNRYGAFAGDPVKRLPASFYQLPEVRSDITQGRIARVLFCIHDERMVLLHGFVKKTQKTPDADLELATKRQREIT
jgi:phage-related protein